MRPLEAFERLISRFIMSDAAKRHQHRGPGKIVEGMPSEVREALTQLKSDDIGPDTKVPEYWMMGDRYQQKFDLLALEKELGIEPPPRKKYDQHG